jgi:hypothetical protein
MDKGIPSRSHAVSQGGREIIRRSQSNVRRSTTKRSMSFSVPSLRKSYLEE